MILTLFHGSTYSVKGTVCFTTSIVAMYYNMAITKTTNKLHTATDKSQTTTDELQMTTSK